MKQEMNIRIIQAENGVVLRVTTFEKDPTVYEEDATFQETYYVAKSLAQALKYIKLMLNGNYEDGVVEEEN